MKNIFLLLLLSFVFLYPLSAQDVQNAVKLMSFEQGYLDYKASLSLKNTTDKTIKSIKFQIVYLDMKGNPTDTRDYSENVQIAPGMTKRINIPAYEHHRNYQYYKSKFLVDYYPAFKVDFKLKDCTSVKSDADNSKDVVLNGKVTMQSYEQSYLDNKGSLVLKNNTDHAIRSVKFQLVYLNMDGIPIDYQDFSRSVNIDPGMVKKIDVPGFEHHRNYQYYKSEFLVDYYPTFKVKYTLKDYSPRHEAETAQSADTDKTDKAVVKKEPVAKKEVAVKKAADAVALQSYIQDGDDPQATLVLKNNTDQIINDITFQIIYLDMNNNPQDYRNYHENIEIEPGMVKKLRIDSYERRNGYYYYKSDNNCFADHPFKIQYKLKSYNTKETVQDINTVGSTSENAATPFYDEKADYTYDDDTESSDSDEEYGFFLAYMPILLLLFFILLPFFFISSMARSRKRDPAFWILLSLLISPLLVVIILLFIGDKETYGRR